MTVLSKLPRLTWGSLFIVKGRTGGGLIAGLILGLFQSTSEADDSTPLSTIVAILAFVVAVGSPFSSVCTENAVELGWNQIQSGRLTPRQPSWF